MNYKKVIMFLVLFFSVFVANAQVPPPPVSPVPVDDYFYLLSLTAILFVWFFLKNQTKTTNIKNSNLK